MLRTSTHIRTVAAVAALGVIMVMACLPGAPATGAAATLTRACRYVPDVSVPASMPPDLLVAPVPTPAPPTSSPTTNGTSAEGVDRQLGTLDGLLQIVRDHYVYPDALGPAWDASSADLRERVATGLTDDSFHALLNSLVQSLGDQHSYVQSAAQVQAEADAIAGQNDFVGIGAMFLPIAGTDTAAVMTVFGDSPAADAGLLPHDVLLAVDGGPIRDESGMGRTRGPEGTPVTLTVRRPGEAPREITVARRRVTGNVPIDACLVPGTRIGYLFLPTLLDETIDDQVRQALTALTADGPLDGLVLDDRVDGGGLGSVADSIMGLFAAGPQGAWVSRDDSIQLRLEPQDVGGSQTVPLVVLVGPDTVSYGEILAGVLRQAGRALVMGQPTLGNVEQLRAYDLPDGSRSWLASAAFRPRGDATGIWERTGIIPDVVVPSRWDLFTEATDPALAAAVDLLRGR